MGGEEDGSAGIAQLPHHPLESVGGLGVQPHKRLVHDDQFGVMEPGGDDGQLLLHAVGIGGNGLGQVRRQLKEVSVLADALLPGLGVYTKNVRNEVQVLDARHVLVQVRIVGNVGHIPLAVQRLGADGLAVHDDFPGVKLQNARHCLEGGGLAGAVVADKAVDLPCPDVQAQVVHRFFLSVGLC